MTSSKLLQRLGTGLLVAVLALGGVACGDDDGDDTAANGGATTTAAGGQATTVPQLTAPTAAPTTAATGGGGNTITIQNFAFMGIDNTRANTAWTITNRDSVPHTVTADDNSFDSGRMASGNYVRTFEAPGTVNYHCTVHTRMRGTILVG